VIAYFDTSAIVPLVVEDAGSPRADQMWDAAERAVTTRIAYAEARAALAQAQRMGRLNPKQLRDAVAALSDRLDEADVIEIDAALVAVAGDLAEARHLRGYDAVHLAAAVRIHDDDLVLVAGDGALLGAATAEGIAIAAVS
jgi:predicted nucleic acid-binding protein